jgi:ribonuclease-3
MRTPGHPASALERAIGYIFRDRQLLTDALAHSSLAGRSLKNERLEYLGDAVLSAAVARHLFIRYPKASEGDLSRMRAMLVSRPALAERARAIGLSDHLVLARGQTERGGDTILAHSLESLIGAVWLDSDYPTVAGLLDRVVLDALESILRRESLQNYKSLLLELVQQRTGRQPVYETVAAQGLDHSREFTVVVKVDGQVQGRGTGPNKKEAEQQAARAALAHMQS